MLSRVKGTPGVSLKTPAAKLQILVNHSSLKNKIGLH